MKQVQINYERCIGCRHCEIACIVEHSSSKDIFQCINENPLPKRFINVEVNDKGLTFPVNCRHCEIPLCMNVCPMSAITRNEAGFIQVDSTLCIGCGMCGLACPFGVITYGIVTSGAFEKRIAMKCDGCRERVSQGKIPACVEACKTGALVYESWDDYEKSKRKNLIFSISEEPSPKIPNEILRWREYLKGLSSIREV